MDESTKIYCHYMCCLFALFMCCACLAFPIAGIIYFITLPATNHSKEYISYILFACSGISCILLILIGFCRSIITPDQGGSYINTYEVILK